MEDKELKEVEKELTKFLKSKKKTSKEHKQMMKTHKKNLKKIYKNTNPFDYAFGLDYLIEHIRWMKDFYSYNEQVVGEDNTKLTRLESLTKTLNAYDKWQELEDNIAEGEEEQKQLNKDIIKARNEVFKLLGKHIQEWRD